MWPGNWKWDEVVPSWQGGGGKAINAIYLAQRSCWGHSWREEQLPQVRCPKSNTLVSPSAMTKNPLTKIIMLTFPLLFFAVVSGLSACRPFGAQVCGHSQLFRWSGGIGCCGVLLLESGVLAEVAVLWTEGQRTCVYLGTFLWR